MKTLKYLCLALLALVATSCEKDEAGATATEAMAGQWYVTVDAVDNTGATVAEDFFGMGHILMLTYNTAANTPGEIWVSDLKNFWSFAVKATCDQNAKTFATNGAAPSSVAQKDGSVYECNVTITDGKILNGAATTPHGTPADSIVFYVSFDDDTYPAYYGYDKYKVSGYRYTGLTVDD